MRLDRYGLLDTAVINDEAILYKRSILEKFVNDFSEFSPEQRLHKTLMVKLVNEIIIFSDGRVIVEMKNGMQITTQQ